MKQADINKTRCAWVKDDPIDIHYHDHEWGVPIYDDRLLFEFLVFDLLRLYAGGWHGE